MTTTTFQNEILACTASFDELSDPNAILNSLHDVTLRHLGVRVLGAGRLPPKWGDWQGVEKGKSVFVHSSVPTTWWDAYVVLARQRLDLGMMMARLTLAPYTWTESMKMLEPLGIDRLPYELNLKYGMRDGFTCPVGARWVFAYWSPKVLAKFPEQARALLFMAASLGAIRLERLVGADARRVGNVPILTPRELAVLRLLSFGHRTQEIAEHLELGEETVRSHLKKAQNKLGVKDRTHAVAEAMRQHLIP
jgi:DNA-binding CsgD family transcriptional regulator